MFSRLLKLSLIPIAAAPALLLLVQWSGVEKLTVFLGRFHPVVLHLPIGLLSYVALLETLRLISFGRFKQESQLPMFLAAISATMAMTLGILLMWGEAMQGELIEDHLMGGIATAIMALICLTFRQQPKFEDQRWIRVSYRASVFFTCAVLTWASHEGASITHGETYLTDHIPWLEETVSDKEQAMVSGMMLPFEERIAYTDLIAPIFEGKCYACHMSKSFKGGLIMDTHAGLMAGGVSGSALEPGDAAASYTMERIHLPLADEDRMPPANEPQLTDEEITLIAWWIDQGASADATIAALTPNAAVTAAIETVTTALLADADTTASTSDAKSAKAGNEHHDGHTIDLAAIQAARDQISSGLAKAQEQTEGVITYPSHQSSDLTFRSRGHPVTDKDLASLAPIAAHLISLNAPDATITPAGAAAFQAMPRLTRLDLAGAQISDGVIEQINLPSLEVLNLFNTPVTDTSVPALTKLTGLKRLYLSGTNITVEGLTRLQTALPDCQVISQTSLDG